MSYSRARMCPEFCDSASIAALFGVGTEASPHHSDSNGPVDLSTPSSSPVACGSSRVNRSAHSDPAQARVPVLFPPTHTLAWTGSRFSAVGNLVPSRRDSYDTIDYPVTVPVHLNAGWTGELQGANSRFCARDNLTSLHPGSTKTPGMPKVVENQRDKFDNDPVFRRLGRESEIRYAGIPYERPPEQRRQAFERDVERGSLLMSVVSSGIHIVLTFRNPVEGAQAVEESDLPAAELRNNMLHIRCRMILNGVCVIWNGYVDKQTLDGLGRVEYDTVTADAERTALQREQRRAS